MLKNHIYMVYPKVGKWLSSQNPSICILRLIFWMIKGDKVDVFHSTFTEHLLCVKRWIRNTCLKTNKKTHRYRQQSAGY